MSNDIERLEWWITEKSNEMRMKANREKLRQIEEKDKTFCREVKLKNQNNEQDNKTDHKD